MWQSLYGRPRRNTISGLLQKRSGLIGEAMKLRERLAVVGNNKPGHDKQRRSASIKNRKDSSREPPLLIPTFRVARFAPAMHLFPRPTDRAPPHRRAQ